MSLYVPYYRPFNKHNTDIHASGWIRTRNPSTRAAADPRLRPHGHGDRLHVSLVYFNVKRYHMSAYLRYKIETVHTCLAAVQICNPYFCHGSAALGGSCKINTVVDLCL
jgi:hypothetical protein